MQAARVPKDEGARAQAQRTDGRARDELVELGGGCNAASSGCPRPQRRVRPLVGTPWHVSQLVGACLGIGEVEDHSHKAFVLCVAMPFLPGLDTLEWASL